MVTLAAVSDELEKIAAAKKKKRTKKKLVPPKEPSKLKTWAKRTAVIAAGTGLAAGAATVAGKVLHHYTSKMPPAQRGAFLGQLHGALQGMSKVLRSNPP